MRIVGEQEFRARIRVLFDPIHFADCGSVTGPGRSGAVAAVYVSHRLGLPFVPFGSKVPPLGRLLIVDTATQSGRTLRKAQRRYAEADPVVVAVFSEPPQVAFWYEATKPQHYRHERSAAA